MKKNLTYIFALFFKRNLVTFGLLLFLSTTIQGQDSCHFTFSGKIIDMEHGKALEFSTIEERNGLFNLITDAYGHFEIKGLCKGTYNLHIKHLICEHLDLELTLLSDTFVLLKLPHTSHTTGLVTVRGARYDRIQEGYKLTQKELEAKHGDALATMLTDLPGLSVLQTGGTVSKPIINGMYGYRTILLNNEVRLEGQNWGQEHAPEIDPFIAKEVTLLKGPEALQHGPDALGGVVSVQPATLFNYRKNKVKGQINSASALNGRMGLLAAQVGGRLFTRIPLYWRLQGTVRNQGNQNAPNYYIDNTGYKENNFSWALGTHYKQLTADLYYSQFNTAFGVYTGAHIGNVTDLQQVIAGLVPPIDNGFTYKLNAPRQEANHELFKARIHVKVRDHALLKVIYARQFNQRKEYDLHIGNPELPELNYKLTTHTLTLAYSFESKYGFSHQIGSNLLYQANTFRGRFFIPNFEHQGAGAYYMVEKNWGKNSFSGTIRADLRTLTAYFYNANDSLLSPHKRFLNSAWSLAWQRVIGHKLTWRNSLDKNWRNPMANELYSAGIHHGSATYEEGNASLTEEVAYKIESNIDWTPNHRFRASMGVFVQHVNGFINLIPAAEPKATIRGAFPFFYYDQTDALFRGINYSTNWFFSKRFQLEHKGFLLWADDISRNTYLPQMPPFIFHLNPSFHYKKHHIKLSTQFVARQFRFEENTDFAPPPNGYFLLGIEWKGPVTIAKKSFNCFIRGENLLNSTYRDYLDRFRYFVDRPGLQLRVGISYSFDTDKNQFSSSHAIF